MDDLDLDGLEEPIGAERQRRQRPCLIPDGALQTAMEAEALADAKKTAVAEAVLDAMLDGDVGAARKALADANLEAVSLPAVRRAPGPRDRETEPPPYRASIIRGYDTVRLNTVFTFVVEVPDQDVMEAGGAGEAGMLVLSRMIDAIAAQAAADGYSPDDLATLRPETPHGEAAKERVRTRMQEAADHDDDLDMEDLLEPIGAVDIPPHVLCVVDAAADVALAFRLKDAPALTDACRVLIAMLDAEEAERLLPRAAPA